MLRVRLGVSGCCDSLRGSSGSCEPEGSSGSCEPEGSSGFGTEFSCAAIRWFWWTEAHGTCSRGRRSAPLARMIGAGGRGELEFGRHRDAPPAVPSLICESVCRARRHTGSGRCGQSSASTSVLAHHVCHFHRQDHACISGLILGLRAVHQVAALRVLYHDVRD
eukprot:1669699-Rhodomonas_salina.1